MGLGYITLGHSAVTLSGGEAQRVKLSTELGKKDTGKTFYILDEPTTGLHFEDIQHLLDVLNKLVDRGNTVLVIEHNMDVIKVADHIIDLGPEGGDGGGRSYLKEHRKDWLLVRIVIQQNFFPRSCINNKRRKILQISLISRKWLKTKTRSFLICGFFMVNRRAR